MRQERQTALLGIIQGLHILLPIAGGHAVAAFAGEGNSLNGVGEWEAVDQLSRGMLCRCNLRAATLETASLPRCPGKQWKLVTSLPPFPMVCGDLGMGGVCIQLEVVYRIVVGW